MFALDEVLQRAVTDGPGWVTCLARVRCCVPKQAPVQVLCWVHLSHTNTLNKCNKHRLSQSSDSGDIHDEFDLNDFHHLVFQSRVSLNSPGLHWLYFDYPAAGVWTISAKTKKVSPMIYSNQSCADVWLHGLFGIRADCRATDTIRACL